MSPPAYRPTSPPIVVPAASGEHSSTLIMLHGLGDTGEGWAFLAERLRPLLPHTEFIFPHAPLRPIARFGGEQSTAWFDIYPVPQDPQAPRPEDVSGLLATRRYVEELLEQQAAAGVPSSHVVVGGFSQGGAIALLMLRSALPLAGVLVLSGVLPMATKEPLISEANARTPVLLCHGEKDEMLTLDRAGKSVERLQGAGANLEHRFYAGMGHTTRADELEAVTRFLFERLGNAN